jgi:hypothetical protein
LTDFRRRFAGWKDFVQASYSTALYGPVLDHLVRQHGISAAIDE